MAKECLNIFLGCKFFSHTLWRGISTCLSLIDNASRLLSKKFLALVTSTPSATNWSDVLSEACVIIKLSFE